MGQKRLLVVDDDGAARRLIAAIFVPAGFEVLTAADAASGLQALDDQPDVVLLDLHLPGTDGLALLQQIKQQHPSIPVIMLTASRDVKTAVRAIQLGAFDWITKPVEPEELVVIVRRALEARDLQVEVQDLRRRVGRSEAEHLASQMGPSAQVGAIIEQVETVAASNFSVLILGETGTGKEVVAQAIHRGSDRARKPFVALDCGAIPEALLESELFGHERGAFTGADRRRQGRFQLAERGTVLLDEVGNLATSLQMKLLRVLESREVQAVGADRPVPIDVRFLAATNLDLQARVGAGDFRADLYFRLAQYTIRLPPLRERVEDIPFLTARFVQEVSVELRRPVQALVPDAVTLLQDYAWPGNVRELRNVVRQAVLEARDLVIRPEALRPLLGAATTGAPGEVAPGGSLRDVADQAAHAAERLAIGSALQATGGNKSQAARLLRTDYKTLHVKMRQLGISASRAGRA